MPKEVLDGGRLRGGIIRSHIQWVSEQELPGGIERLQAQVSEEAARVLSSPVLPISWYPFRVLVEIDRAIASAVDGEDDRAVIEGLGRYSARANLSSDFRFFNRGDPHAFFANVARIHRQFQDFGQAAYEHLDELSCRISMLDPSCYSPVYCWSAAGYYAESAALQGAVSPRVVESECACEGGRACRYEIRWG